MEWCNEHLTTATILFTQLSFCRLWQSSSMHLYIRILDSVHYSFIGLYSLCTFQVVMKSPLYTPHFHIYIQPSPFSTNGPVSKLFSKNKRTICELAALCFHHQNNYSNFFFTYVFCLSPTMMVQECLFIILPVVWRLSSPLAYTDILVLHLLPFLFHWNMREVELCLV